MGVTIDDYIAAKNNGEMEDIHELKIRYEIRDWIVKYQNAYTYAKINVDKWIGKIKLGFEDLIKLDPNKTEDFMTSHYIHSCKIDKVPMYKEDGSCIFPTIKIKTNEMVLIFNFLNFSLIFI